MATIYHVNPRIRAYGKARIDVTRRARDEAEWQELWREPLHPFPFDFGDGWNFGIEYKVDDFAAEAGFFIDVLGFPVRAFSPSYAQFVGPHGEFSFSISARREGEESTPADTLRLQFMVENIMETAETLVERGIVFEKLPEPIHPGAAQAAGFFRSPHGVCIDLWGEITPKTDIHDYLENEDELDDPETERILQCLLRLPDEEAEGVEEDELVEADADQAVSELEPEYVEVEEDDEESDDISEGQPPAQAEAPASSPTPRQQVVPAITGQRPSNTGSSQRQPAPALRNRVSPTSQPRINPSMWSARDRRSSSEPTYQEIEEDEI